MSIGAVVEGTSGVEYCARGEWLSGDDGARSGISMEKIGVEALQFFSSLSVWGVLWLVPIAMY